MSFFFQLYRIEYGETDSALNASDKLLDESQIFMDFSAKKEFLPWID